MKLKIKSLALQTSFALLMLTVSANINTASANVEADMAGMFNDMGAQSSYSSPGAYKSQASNLYTGGGFSAKFGNKNLNPINIQLPSASGGCGGIDFFAGAFSFVNKEQFLEFTRNLGNNAAGVAFDIALDALDPLVGGKIAQIRDLVTKVNQFGMNSCQIARSAVGGLAGSLGVSIGKECESTSLETGRNSDGTEAAWYCQSAGRLQNQRESVRNQYSSEKANNKTSIAMTGGNLTMMASEKYNLNTEEKRWLMSLVGTMVAPPPKDKNGNAIPAKSEFKPPLINGSGDILQYFSSANQTGTVKVKLYRCSKEPGGAMSVDAYNAVYCVPEDVEYKSFISLVRERIKILKDGIDSGTRLSGADNESVLKMVNSSTLPLLKMALLDSTSGLNLTERASQVIALDLAQQYLSNMVKVAKEMMGTYASQDDAEREKVKSGYEDLNNTLSTIREEYAVSLQKASNELTFSEYLKNVDNMFKSSSPSLANSINFSKLISAK